MFNLVRARHLHFRKAWADCVMINFRSARRVLPVVLQKCQMMQIGTEDVGSRHGGSVTHDVMLQITSASVGWTHICHHMCWHSFFSFAMPEWGQPPVMPILPGTWWLAISSDATALSFIHEMQRDRQRQRVWRYACHTHPEEQNHKSLLLCKLHVAVVGLSHQQWHT